MVILCECAGSPGVFVVMVGYHNGEALKRSLCLSLSEQSYLL